MLNVKIICVIFAHRYKNTSNGNGMFVCETCGRLSTRTSILAGDSQIKSGNLFDPIVSKFDELFSETNKNCGSIKKLFAMKGALYPFMSQNAHN